MLTYLEDTNQYIYVDLVLQFMIFINKENKENSLAKKFLKKYNKEHNNEHDEEYDDGVKYLLRAIVERLKEEGDNVSLERMHWIFTSPKLKKIYKSEELDKLKIQIQSYNPN